MSPIGIILLILVVLLVVGGLPVAPWWQSGHSYGYYPSGLGLVLLILLLFFLSR